MKINPQTFFNCCANHVPLLRGLASIDRRNAGLEQQEAWLHLG